MHQWRLPQWLVVPMTTTPMTTWPHVRKMECVSTSSVHLSTSSVQLRWHAYQDARMKDGMRIKNAWQHARVHLSSSTLVTTSTSCHNIKLLSIYIGGGMYRGRGLPRISRAVAWRHAHAGMACTCRHAGMGLGINTWAEASIQASIHASIHASRYASIHASRHARAVLSVYSSALQCAAVCCSTLQRQKTTAIADGSYASLRWCIIAQFRQCIAVCCSVL